MKSNDPSENADTSEIGASHAEDRYLRLLNKRNVLKTLTSLLFGTLLFGHLVGL